MAKFRVQIVERDGEFSVEPPIVALAVGDKFKLFNTTREDLVFRLDNTGPFGATKLENVKSDGSTVQTVPAGAPDGVYAYQVLMVRSGKKGKGNSDPVIIIDN